MFNLLDTHDHSRVGELSVNNKTIETPSMFYQNSFPGGGGDVNRFITYTDLMNNIIPVLHNYFYLSNRGTYKTRSGLLIEDNESINTYMLRLRDFFCGQIQIQTNKRQISTDPPWISNQHTYNNLTINDWDPITLLDSGSGNFLLTFIENLFDANNDAPSPADVFAEFQNLTPEYFEFCDHHTFDIMMALDYAEKNTDKQWADRQELQAIANRMTHSAPANLELLQESLRQMQLKEHDFDVFAPIHGRDIAQFTGFTEQILEMEQAIGQKFDGFGLAPPKDSTERVRIVRAVRRTLEQNNDTRPIHALGAGAIRDVIPLVFAGADMFDNATSWRRATDGSGKVAKNVNDPDATGSFSCFLIPLVDRNGEVIPTNQENVLGYARLNKITTNFSCDCDICNEFSMHQIQELYSQGSGSEDFNFAKILCYNHAINQYHFICGRLRNDIRDGVGVTNLVNEIVDPRLQNQTRDIIASI